MAETSPRLSGAGAQPPRADRRRQRLGGDPADRRQRAIILLGGYDAPYTWVVVILYFVTCHATLIFFGAIGLARALSAQTYRYPLIGRPIDE